jgi:hypothetical protein
VCLTVSQPATTDYDIVPLWTLTIDPLLAQRGVNFQ